METDFDMKTDFSAAFIGFGLIGGSIAKALKKACPGCHLLALDHHAGPSGGSSKNAALLKAVEDGVLDGIETELTRKLAQCQVIFLCAPVLTNIAYLEKLKPLLSPDTILTDVGSVKNNIYEGVCRLGLEASFVGGHPMTGSEKTGYENASSLLMENAYYILCPAKSTPDRTLSFMEQLVRAMGSIPIILEAGNHDNIVAAISHVPHIIAACLVNMVCRFDDEENHMFSLAAGGFKDITRIASSSPVMWQNICLTNQKSISLFLSRYIKELTDMQHLLSSQKEDELLTVFQSAKDYRDSLPKPGINIPGRIYEVYLDTIDEAGAIASIATLLAGNSISIKNIGILHNREFEEGVLRIEFYEDISLHKAVDLLKRHHYTLYQR